MAPRDLTGSATRSASGAAPRPPSGGAPRPPSGGAAPRPPSYWQCRTALWLSLVVALAAAAAARFSDPLVPVHATGVVVVTGASTGIGAAAALHAARTHPGWVVFAGVRRAADAAATRALGVPNLQPLTLDVSDPASVEAAARVVDAACDGGGGRAPLPLIGVVLNAGVARGPTTVEHHEPRDAAAVFDVNVLGALRVLQRALPRLRAAQGRVVFVSSVFGALAPPMGGVYSASKFALEALADALRRETRGLAAPLSVSVVQPGAVKTPIFDTLRNASIAAAAAAGSPAALAYPHLHTPADLANELRIEALADSDAVTTAAIDHALAAPRPQTR